MNALLLGMMLADLKAEARQAGEARRALRKRVAELEAKLVEVTQERDAQRELATRACEHAIAGWDAAELSNPPVAATERLPAPERPVLGWVPAYDGWAAVAWLPNNSGPGEWYYYFSFGEESVRQFTSVSHWLPLPERPS